jgi:hypothetical protein
VIAQTVETLIPFVSELKQTIESVKDAYLKLPPLIEREHRAIKGGIFSEAQAICEEKEVLTLTIEDGFHSLSKAAADVSRLTGNTASTLKEAVASLQIFIDQNASDNSLAQQVLRHVSTGVCRLAQELEETVRTVKPLIEANRDLVTELMQSYGQSYRFWQEIQEQISSSYTPDGVQKVIGRVSGFRARA